MSEGCRTVGRFRNRAPVKIHHSLAVVNPLVHVLAVVTDGQHHALRNQVMLDQSHRDGIDHLAHHEPRLIKGVRVLQDLSFASAATAGLRLLDIGNRAGFVTPGMVNQDFRIHAEHLVQRFGILDARARKVAHRADSPPTVQVALFQARCNPAAHLPKTRNRLVRPQLLAVAHLVKLRDAHTVFVGFHMLRHHVHRDLAKVQVRADAASRRNPRRREHVLDNRLHQFARGLLVQLEVASQIQKTFIDGIGVNIFSTHVFEVNVVDLRGILHVLRHLRLGNQEFDFLARTAFHLAHLLVHLEKAGTSRNPVSLERRRYRKANRLLGASPQAGPSPGGYIPPKQRTTSSQWLRRFGRP